MNDLIWVAIGVLVLLLLGLWYWRSRKPAETYQVVNFWHNAAPYLGSTVIRLSTPLDASVQTGAAISVTITQSNAAGAQATALYSVFDPYNTTISGIDSTRTIVFLAATLDILKADYANSVQAGQAVV